MSALAAFMSEDQFIIATDSLSTLNHGFPPIPHNLASKIDYYAHLKCCVVGLGINGIITQYRNFIHDAFITDVSGLFEITKDGFHDYMDLSEIREDLLRDGKYISKLFIFGYSDLKQKLVAYRIEIHQDSIEAYEMSANNSELIHPPVDQSDKIRICNENPFMNVDGILTEYVKQMKEDSKSSEKYTVCVGGEIHLTIIASKPSFSCSFLAVHRFDDYEETVLNIAALRAIMEMR